MNPLKNLRAFLSDYCHFADPNIVRPLSLWICGTYLYEAFDSFPYLAITAHVKRAGKTRLSELIAVQGNQFQIIQRSSEAYMPIFSCGIFLKFSRNAVTEKT